MAATQDQIDQLRRMLGGVATATYSDVTLAAYIEAYPRIDALGRDPYRINAAIPGVPEANPFAQATYDLNAAASVLWGEIASSLAAKFDFSTDGQSFQRSQQFEQAQRQSRYYAARRAPSTITLTPSPLRIEVADATEIIEP